MCMQNINVTIRLYKNIVQTSSNQSFSMPFDTILAKTHGSSKYINDFIIDIYFNMLGTNRPENKETNIVENKGTIYVRVNMCKIANIPEQKLYRELSEFEINLASEDVTICKSNIRYVVFERMLNITEIELPDRAELGAYVINALIKTDKNIKKWNLQSLCPLRVE